MKDLVDLHTHTIASVHAYSTINEMINAAVEHGLHILGITDHGPQLSENYKIEYFEGLKFLPRKKKR